MAEPMTPSEMERARKHVADIHACYHDLGNASTNLRRIVRLFAEVERLRAELADRDQRLDQAMQDEARITHEWDQARMAIERMGRILDGSEATP